MPEITQILAAVTAGQPGAQESLIDLVYDELHRIAVHRMASEPQGNTVQATMLVHDAWQRLMGAAEGQQFSDRTHFFAAAATAMRRLLIEAARKRNRHKRGGDCEHIPIEGLNISAPSPSEEMLLVAEVLEDLRQEYSLVAKVVDYRYFLGMTNAEAASVLGISPKASEKIWDFGKTWLFRALSQKRS